MGSIKNHKHLDLLKSPPQVPSNRSIQQESGYIEKKTDMRYINIRNRQNTLSSSMIRSAARTTNKPEAQFAICTIRML